MQQATLIKNIVAQLQSVRGVQAIVLGGSYASGMHQPDSDVDIAIYRTILAKIQCSQLTRNAL